VPVADAQAQSQRDKANQQAAEQSTQFIANMPRYGGVTSLDADTFKSIMEGETSVAVTYAIGLISLAAASLIIPVLGFAICPLWFCCRCCACCCCKKTPPNKQLTFMNIWFCYFVLIAMSLVLVIFAGIGYEANNEFSDALINDGDSSLYGQFLEVLDDGVAKLHEIADSISGIGDAVQTAIGEVNKTLQGTDVIQSGTDDLIWMLNNTEHTWSEKYIYIEYKNKTQNFSCAFCETISEQVGNVKTELETSVTPVFNDLGNVVDPIQDTLVDAGDDITSSIDDFSEMISDNDELITEQKELIDDKLGPQLEEFNSIREQAYNGLFAIPILPIVFALLGGLFKLSICFTLTYILLWFSFTFMFVLLAVHLPIAALLSDICGLFDEIDKNVTGTVGNNDFAKIFASCLDDSSLLDVFGVSDDLNFTSLISFDALDQLDLGSAFNLTAFDSFENSAFNLSFNTFYENGNEAIKFINNVTAYISNNVYTETPHVYTRENINTTFPDVDYYYPNVDLTPSTDDDNAKRALQASVDVVMAEKLAVTEFNNTINKIKANMSNIVDQANHLEGTVDLLVKNLTKAEQLLDPVFVQVEAVFDVVTCGFIGEAYWDVKDIMCGQGVLGSLARIVVSMLVIGICSVVACCASVKMVRKIEWRNLQAKEAKSASKSQNQSPYKNQNEQRPMLGQPQQPTVIVMQQPMSMGMQGQPAYGYPQQPQPYGR
jgi:archaellum component FlaC